MPNKNILIINKMKKLITISLLLFSTIMLFSQVKTTPKPVVKQPKIFDLSKMKKEGVYMIPFGTTRVEAIELAKTMGFKLVKEEISEYLGLIQNYVTDNFCNTGHKAKMILYASKNIIINSGIIILLDVYPNIIDSVFNEVNTEFNRVHGKYLAFNKNNDPTQIIYDTPTCWFYLTKNIIGYWGAKNTIGIKFSKVLK